VFPLHQTPVSAPLVAETISLRSLGWLVRLVACNRVRRSHDGGHSHATHGIERASASPAGGPDTDTDTDTHTHAHMHDAYLSVLNYGSPLTRSLSLPAHCPKGVVPALSTLAPLLARCRGLPPVARVCFRLRHAPSLILSLCNRLALVGPSVKPLGPITLCRGCWYRCCASAPCPAALGFHLCWSSCAAIAANNKGPGPCPPPPGPLPNCLCVIPRHSSPLGSS
jgi:hypothetical protein